MVSFFERDEEVVEKREAVDRREGGIWCCFLRGKEVVQRREAEKKGSKTKEKRCQKHKVNTSTLLKGSQTHRVDSSKETLARIPPSPTEIEFSSQSRLKSTENSKNISVKVDHYLFRGLGQSRSIPL
ncbi:hypothetical protein Sjap_011229 [Stephania japonica]|uniref:Uncharacterized protein n=1 Tax=Stephania japonica TaxID=461633 RepID=A0AAP0JD48_9MAGN